MKVRPHVLPPAGSHGTSSPTRAATRSPMRLAATLYWLTSSGDAVNAAASLSNPYGCGSATSASWGTSSDGNRSRTELRYSACDRRRIGTVGMGPHRLAVLPGSPMLPQQPGPAVALATARAPTRNVRVVLP